MSISHRSGASTVEPPVINSLLSECALHSVAKTLEVCAASSRVGLTHTTRTGPLSKREQASTAATANAIVFPDPVTASATTSFCVSNSGRAAAWTGVIVEKRKSFWRHVNVASLRAGRNEANDCAIAAAPRYRPLLCSHCSAKPVELTARFFRDWAGRSCAVAISHVSHAKKLPVMARFCSTCS